MEAGFDMIAHIIGEASDLARLVDFEKLQFRMTRCSSPLLGISVMRKRMATD